MLGTGFTACIMERGEGIRAKIIPDMYIYIHIKICINI